MAGALAVKLTIRFTIGFSVHCVFLSRWILHSLISEPNSDMKSQSRLATGPPLTSQGDFNTMSIDFVKYCQAALQECSVDRSRFFSNLARPMTLHVRFQKRSISSDVDEAISCRTPSGCAGAPFPQPSWCLSTNIPPNFSGAKYLL